MIETILLNILKFKNDLDIAEINQILFATNIKSYHTPNVPTVQGPL